MFVGKKVYDEVGLYDITYKLAADGEWQYRALEDSRVRFLLIDQVLNHMREGGASDNPKLRWKWFSERTQMRIKHKKASRAIIYLQEFGKVITTDAKAILPEKIKNKLYMIKYNGMTVEK